MRFAGMDSFVKNIFMKDIKQLHAQHLELYSEIAFLKQEINFFLKLLSKAYSDSIDKRAINVLDGYWKEFERCGEQLALVSERIENCEKHAKSLFAEKGIARCQDDEECTMGLKHISRDLKIIKESFYAFMIDNYRRVYEKA
ncbi:MAG: hypothetical protein ACJ75J_15055 [Cytophagaceae bacterium]